MFDHVLAVVGLGIPLVLFIWAVWEMVRHISHQPTPKDLVDDHMNSWVDKDGFYKSSGIEEVYKR